MKKDAQNVLMSFCLVIVVVFGGGVSYFERSYEQSIKEISVANYNLRSILSNREEREQREREEAARQAAIEKKNREIQVVVSGASPTIPNPVIPVVFSAPTPTPVPVKQDNNTQVVTVKPSRSSRAS